MLELRTATAADAGTVAALHATSWRAAYRGLMTDRYLDGQLAADRLAVWSQRLARNTDPRRRVTLALRDGAPVGFVCVQTPSEWPHAWGLELDNLHVVPGAGGNGIGRRLMAVAAAAVLASGVTRAMHLAALAGNHPARAFYAHLGGVEFARAGWDAPDGQHMVCVMFGWRDVAALLPQRAPAPNLAPNQAPE